MVTGALPPEFHPEHIRYTWCKLSERSGSLGTEMLRCAQHDNGWIWLAAFSMTRLDVTVTLAVGELSKKGPAPVK